MSLIGLSHNWTRKEVENDKDYLYIFTDNLNRSSGRNLIDTNSYYYKKYSNGSNLFYPNTTQAVIRGLNNAYPISTMKNQYKTQLANSDFDLYSLIIKDEVSTIINNLVNYKGIKFSNTTLFGKGKYSKMDQYAPMLFYILNLELKKLGF